MGIDPRRIEAPQPVGGSLRYHVTDDQAVSYDVSLRTPDERDADLLNRAYRGLRFHASEVGPGFASLKRRIEHEALALTLAERHGVRVASVLGIGTTSRGAVFLVTRAPTTRPIDIDDLQRPKVIDSIWHQVGELHDAGLAHRHLSLEAITIDDAGEVWLRQFDSAETAPPERETARDLAVLLTETAAVIGPTAAVSAAVSALGARRVAPALRMLQPLALPPATRSRAKAVDGLLGELREELNRATGEPGLELEDLERLKPRTVLIVVASTLAFYSLLPQLANLDETIDAFADAEPLWIIATLMAAAATFVFAAIAFQGAVADPLPFAPTLRTQLAASFALLVGPAGAGGYALNGRFLQRAGVGGAETAASVAVKVIAGFAVHLTLLVGFVLWSGQSDIGGFSFPDAETVLLVIAVVLALVGLLISIGPIRTRWLGPAVAMIKTGVGQIGQVFRRPLRVVALFGGSAGLSLTFIAAMAFAIQAFGGGLTYPQVGAAYLFAVAIATFAPTPGGLGALESALIAGLTGFGLSSGVAVSAVLTFRMATFWLPLLPGWLTLNWMQRNDEL
jgi:undecaprenyl-diphosphatase